MVGTPFTQQVASAAARAHRPQPRDGLSAQLSSEGTQRVARRDPEQMSKAAIRLRGLSRRWLLARPLPDARAKGKLSTKATCRLPRPECRRSLCSRDHTSARASRRRMFSSWAHREDQMTFQSRSSRNSRDTSVKGTLTEEPNESHCLEPTSMTSLIGPPLSGLSWRALRLAEIASSQ